MKYSVHDDMMSDDKQAELVLSSAFRNGQHLMFLNAELATADKYTYVPTRPPIRVVSREAAQAALLDIMIEFSFYCYELISVQYFPDDDEYFISMMYKFDSYTRASQQAQVTGVNMVFSLRQEPVLKRYDIAPRATCQDCADA